MRKIAEFGKWKCEACEKIFRTKRELFAHNKICNKRTHNSIRNQVLIDKECPFCKKHFYKKYSLTNHMSLCKENPNKDLEKYKRCSEGQKKFWNSEKGKLLREKFSKSAIFNNFWEYRSKNPIFYESPIAGKIKLDSLWEKLVAERLDEFCLEWYRPRFRLPYLDNDGIEHSFIPDFYIKTFCCFIEVKSEFISKWQNSNNKIKYIKEHYPFVKWIESENDCKTFSLESLKLLKNYNFNIIPNKIEEIIFKNIDSKNIKKKKEYRSLKNEVLKRERWDIIQNSNIDFSKFGWVKELSDLFHISGNKAGQYVKNNFPQFYDEKCFKRK